MPSSFPPSTPLPAVIDPEEKIRHLPEPARAAFRRFRSERDPAVLDPVILAILEDYVPRQPEKPLAEHAGTAVLIDDLGFDSLAITEVVFFTEDLLGITIANEEIVRVRTLDDLRNFIRAKVAASGTS
jgi:acyl carrier protein